MINYIKKLFVLLLVTIFSFSLFSCGKKSEDVSLKSFYLTESEYQNGDKLTFVIEFANKKNYIITSVKINDQKYNVVCPDEDYNIVYVSDDSLVFDENNTYYKLSSFSYVENLTGGDEITIKSTKICYSSEKEIKESEVVMLSYEIAPINDASATSYYVGDEVSLTINFNNPKKRKITNVIVSFLDAEMNEIKEDSLITVGKINENNTVLKTTVELPSLKGDVSVRIKSIKYVDESLSVCSYAPPLTTMLSPITLLQRPLLITDFKLSANPNYNKDLNKDINGNYYTDKVSTINVDLTIFYESMDEVPIESIFINKNEYNFETYKTFIQKNNYRKEIYIKNLPVIFSQEALASENGLKVYSVGVTRVNFTTKEAFVPSKIIKIDEGIRVYDKIIKTEDDLKSIVVSKDKIVNGTYILNQNINITNNSKIPCLYSDVTFNGYLEGNGKAINNVDVNIVRVPLFKNIGQKAVIQNLSINTGVVSNTVFLAEENNGTINNLSITQNNTVDDAEWSVTERTQLNNLLNINNGLISNISLNGYLKFNSTKDLLILDFSVIANTNNGTIQNVINNLRYEFVGKDSLVNVYLVSMNNTGYVYSVVNTFGSNVDSENKLNGIVKNTVFWLTPVNKVENAQYINVYANARLVANNQTYVNVAEGYNIANMSCKPTEIGTEISSEEPDNIIKLFYLNLGFKTKDYGENNFWYLDANRVPSLKY